MIQDQEGDADVTPDRRATASKEVKGKQTVIWMPKIQLQQRRGRNSLIL